MYKGENMNSITHGVSRTIRTDAELERALQSEIHRTGKKVHALVLEILRKELIKKEGR
jgi:hypothetical protein